LLSLQAAVDRARGEQIALIRCLTQTRSALEQWPNSTNRLASCLEEFGSRLRLTLSKFLSGFDDTIVCVTSISSAFKSAQAARIRGDGDVLRSPLDSLARGTLGPEVAALVQSLRKKESGGWLKFFQL